jgi:hypothetical protein
MRRSLSKLVAYRLLLFVIALFVSFSVAVLSGLGGSFFVLAPNLIFIISSICFRIQSYATTFIVSFVTSILIPLIFIGGMSGMSHRSESERVKKPSPSAYTQLIDLPTTYFVIPSALMLHAWALFVFSSLRPLKREFHE